jgi:U3 small nucleolar RNA-associated protein 14
MIDPISALEGIQKAIKLVKKASQTAQDVGSLAPMIAKMFDARSVATKAMVEAKRSGKGSNMGTAIQIEMALEQARDFEKELQLLFFQANKMDVWQKIKERAQQMDIADAHAAREAKAEEKKRKQKEQEQLEMGLLIGGLAFVLFLVGIGVIELMDYCNTHRCGR